MAIYYVNLSLNTNPGYLVNDQNNPMGWAEFKSICSSYVSHTFYLKGIRNDTTATIWLSHNSVVDKWENDPYQLKIYKFCSHGNLILKNGILECENMFYAQQYDKKIINMFIKCAVLYLTQYLDKITVYIYGSTIISATSTFCTHRDYYYYDSIFNFGSITFIPGDSPKAIFYVQNCVFTSQHFTNTRLTWQLNLNNQFGWTAPTFPVWNAPKESWYKNLLTTGIDTPPQPGTPPYTNYPTDAWGNARTSIGFAYMLQMTEYIHWVDGYPKMMNIGLYDVDFTIKVDNDGTIYFVVVNTDSISPSPIQIMLGVDSNNLPAITSGNHIISQNIEKMISINDLNKNEIYDFYFLAVSETNDNSDVIKISVNLFTFINTIHSNILKIFKHKKNYWPRLLSVPTPSTYRDIVVARKPISFWRLGDGKSVIARDEMRYCNGEYKYAWFDGNEFKSIPRLAMYGQNHSIEINDNNPSTKFKWNIEPKYNVQEGHYINVNHKSRFVGMSTLLVEFFFKMDRPKGHTGVILSKCDSINVNPAYHIEMVNSQLKATVGDGTSVINAQMLTSITDEQWHYVVVLFKNRILKIYLDNILVATSATSLASDDIFPADESTIEIAKTANQTLWSFFNGWIDEVAIYDWDWYS